MGSKHTEIQRPSTIAAPIIAAKQTIQQNELTIQYLGCSGFSITYGDHSILTAPFFSNFLIPELVLPIEPDYEAIHQAYAPLASATTKAILVGHAHYDHLIDIPAIHAEYHPTVPILGSKTMRNLLLSVDTLIPPDSLIKDVVPNMVTDSVSGSWITLAEGAIRILPIQSSHSSHVFGIKFYDGILDSLLPESPSMASDWIEGQTLSYLIDFMEGDSTVYRIYFQDSASDMPYGLVPEEYVADVDVVIMCAGGYTETENYPEYIVERVPAQTYIIGHWENFFIDWSHDPIELANSDELTGDATLVMQNRIKEVAPESNVIIPGIPSVYSILK
ncbi:MAG: hypothetical protein OCD76_09405 [Reichenbachiella sp.]